MAKLIIGIGSVVTIYDEELEERFIYKIVEVKKGENELSADSLLAKSLLGHSIGDIISVKAEESYNVKVLHIDNSTGQISIVNKTNRNLFFCFQGKQFVNEYLGGYIFAGKNPEIHHWNRLRSVKKGDVIFHGNVQGILAISESQGRCFLSKRPKSDCLVGENQNYEGLMVKQEYQMLRNSIILSDYRKDIIRLQGDAEGKGYPFNKNGKGNEGYLFNLNKELARFFIEKIIGENPEFIKMNYIKEFL